jgi:hypothetical protein
LDEPRGPSFFHIAFIGSLAFTACLADGSLNGRGQIPNSEYWFAQERRRETESFLIDHAFWLGCMTLAVVYGIHISIVRANAVTPPVLAVDRFTAIVVMYLCGLVWWLATFLRHFKRHDKHT